jgi:hypothetical protein
MTWMGPVVMDGHPWHKQWVGVETCRWIITDTYLT